MSNLLAIPLTALVVETGNNEDWLDALKFIVANGEPDPPQLDIRDIVFEMEIRHTAAAHEVVLSASTVFGTLRIGSPPDVGFLIFDIPVEDIRNLAAGTYVADITGRDDQYVRRIATMDLTIIEGITKQPVVKVAP